MAAIFDFWLERLYLLLIYKAPWYVLPRSKPFGSGEEANNRFSRWQPWRPSWISDRNCFSFFFFLFFFFFFFFFFFICKSPWSFLPTFKSSGLSIKKKTLKIDFNDGAHLGLSIGIILAVFDVQGNQILPSYQVSSRLAFCFGRRRNKIDGGHGMLISDWNYFNFFLSKIQINWPFDSGEEEKNKLSRWCSWRPAWIADRKDF